MQGNFVRAFTLNDTSPSPADPIDVVITWVNGNAPLHRQKRARYMDQADAPLHENAINPHRWGDNHEIRYCLTSIENFAPWVRKVWIVVDDEGPDLSHLSAAMRSKTCVVLHRDIFGEFSSVLPTFNSLTIESMIWRIPGLADRFVYFNDDVFLCAPLAPGDVFVDSQPVLRGEWLDYSSLGTDPETRADPALFNHFMHINAARIAGFDPGRLFSAAHVAHPMRRDVMAQLFDQHRTAFMANIQYRFRDLEQFLPQGLHNHACLAASGAAIHGADDHLHIHSGQGRGRPVDEVWGILQKAEDPNVKFLCINDLPQLEQLIPNVRDWLGAMVSGR